MDLAIGKQSSIVGNKQGIIPIAEESLASEVDGSYLLSIQAQPIQPLSQSSITIIIEAFTMAQSEFNWNTSMNKVKKDIFFPETEGFVMTVQNQLVPM